MLKPIFIEARDLDDAWFQILWNISKFGRRYHITSGSYEGHDRVALDFCSGFIHLPHTRPLAPRMPEASPLPAPTTDEDIEHYFANYLMDSNTEPNEHYRYATWIAGGEHKLKIVGKNCEIDTILVPNQIEWIIKHFKERGLGNEHCYLQVGYPESSLVYDLPYSNPSERKTSPCLRGLDFRVIDGQLTTHVIYRSWDAYSGWPTNMGGFALLNEYVADALNIEPGPLSFSCKSLHCYDFHLDILNSRVGGDSDKNILIENILPDPKSLEFVTRVADAIFDYAAREALTYPQPEIDDDLKPFIELYKNTNNGVMTMCAAMKWIERRKRHLPAK